MNALLSWKFSLILRLCSKTKQAKNDKRHVNEMLSPKKKKKENKKPKVDEKKILSKKATLLKYI